MVGTTGSYFAKASMDASVVRNAIENGGLGQSSLPKRSLLALFFGLFGCFCSPELFFLGQP